MKTNKILKKGLENALEAIQPTHGIWTLEGFTGSEVNVGRVKLKNGNLALVSIKLQADEEEIEVECDNFDELPILN